MSQVTQARASHDYQREVYDPDQWSLGHTSILFDALGIYPFKDCFWSNGTTQPGCAAPVCQETNPVLQTLVSLLSTGPMAPSDKIGYLSLVNLMQTISADGLILKPDRPARAMDLTFALGFQSNPGLLNLTSTFSSHTIQDGQTNPTLNWHYIFAADTLQVINIGPKDLGELDNGTYFVYDYFQKPTVLSRFQANTPLVIPALVPKGMEIDFKYYIVFQAFDTYSLIGERNKFAVASNQRFNSITKSTQNGNTITTITIAGSSNEQVTLEMLYPSSRQIESYTCTIGSSQTSSLICTESSTSHSCTCNSN